MKYNEIDGNLIELALNGEFDVISHGCNCFCTMRSGIAPQMAESFGCDKFPLELTEYMEYPDDDGAPPYLVKTTNMGDINKLGQIDYKLRYVWTNHPIGRPYAMGHKTVGQADVFDLIVVNSYTQFKYGKKNHSDGVENPVDYEAITMCMRKMNHVFKGKRIGLPLIGCGLAGGDWNIVKGIFQKEFVNCDLTVVHYKP